MVNEVIMYQSMFLLGIIMFGVFTVSFNNYTSLAENLTAENNMDRVLQEIGGELLDLIDTGRSLRGTSSSVEITITLSLESEYAGKSYSITIEKTTDGLSDLVAFVAGAEVARQPLGIPFGTDPNLGEINFSGTINSNDIQPIITYSWNTVGPVETIVLS